MISIIAATLIHFCSANFIGYIEQNGRAYGVKIDTSTKASSIGDGFNTKDSFSIKSSVNNKALKVTETGSKNSMWLNKQFTLIQDTSTSQRMTGVWNAEPNYNGNAVVFVRSSLGALKNVQKSGVLTTQCRSANKRILL